MLEVREQYLWAAPDGSSDGVSIAVGGRTREGGHSAGLPLQNEPHLMLVCKSNLERECLFNGLMMNGLKLPVVSYASIDKNMSLNGAIVILMHIGSKRLADPFFSDEVEAAVKAWHPIPLVLLAEREEWSQVLRAMEIGARGYIPTSVDIKICVEAIHLALAGGMYVPASMLMKPPSQELNDDVLGELLTVREIEVVHAIRVGKSNKIIAFELGMSEGTVKAHVHNIMRKIGAANRTEVACKLHKMYGNKFSEE